MTAMKIKQVLMKRWVKICGGVVAAIALFLLLLPLGVKYYLADWLEKNGADKATIEKLRFNPFAGRITLGGMEVELEGRSILHNYSMVLNLGLTSLFNRDIRLQRAEYRDLYLDLEQYQDGSWRFGSYTMKGERKETKVESAEDVSSAWNFLADQVVFSHCSIHLKTPELTMTLDIEQAELMHLTTREGQPAGSFTFKGQLNDDPVAMQLDTVQLAPQLRLGGKILISRFQLGEISRLLSDVLPVFAGEVGLDGRFLFSQETEKGIQVDYDGAIGVNQPKIGDTDFSTRAGSLTWKGRVHYAGAENSPITIETDGLLAAREFNLKVSGTDLVTEESRIDMSGKTTVTIADNVLVKSDGTLLLEGIELALSPYGVTEEKLSWKGTVQYDSDHKHEGQFVRTEGSLDLGEFQVGGGEQLNLFAMEGKMASWQGTAGFSQKDSGKRPVIDLNGTLLGGELHSTLTERQLRLGQGKVELVTHSTIGLGEDIDIGGQSSLTLHDFSLFEGENNSPVVSFDKLAVAELESRGGKTIAVKDLLTEGLKSEIPGNFPLSIAIPEIRISDFLTDDLATFTAGELHVKSPHVTAVHNSEELVRLDALTVRNISLGEKTKVGAESAQLQNFVFLDSLEDTEKKPAASFSNALLTEISWSNEIGLQSDSLHFDDLVATIVRDKDGTINITRQLAEMQQQGTGQAAEPAPGPSATVAAEESRGVPFKLQKVVVAGASTLNFEDHTLAVPYNTELAISRLEITGLDSSQPDQKTEILLKGRLENRAPVDVAGYILPFKEKPAADMKVELKNYPLANLSAYTVQSVGTALESGQLQLKSSLVLADDKLEMDNAVLLKKLETKTISPKLAAELNNQLPIPLGAALSLLRDNKRNISLDVPLSGPVSKLDVGISDVMITALSKAIVPAASGYLMYALGPYGALAYVGMKVGEKMLEVKLPPVVFPPQQTALAPEHVKYLQRIGKILQDRPETDIQICPQVASWEFLTEQEKAAIPGELIELDEESLNKLLTLGQHRAEAVQSLLENDYGIAESRLLVCDTKIDTKKKTVPAVLLQL
jgi:hypothetical protein